MNAVGITTISKKTKTETKYYCHLLLCTSKRSIVNVMKKMTALECITYGTIYSKRKSISINRIQETALLEAKTDSEADYKHSQRQASMLVKTIKYLNFKRPRTFTEERIIQDYKRLQGQKLVNNHYSTSASISKALYYLFSSLLTAYFRIPHDWLNKKTQLILKY